MPSVGPWIQPADMWVGKEILSAAPGMFHRTIGWEDPEDTTSEESLARYQAYWESTLIDDEEVFEAHATEDGVSYATQDYSEPTYPYSGIQNIPTGFLQSWAAFVDIQVDDSTDDNPMFEPDLPDGATVEYASTEGIYYDEYEYQVPVDVEGTYDADDPLARLPRLLTYGHSLSYYMAENTGHHPFDSGLYLLNWEDAGAILSPWDTKGFTQGSPEIVVAIAFPTQLEFTPHPTGTDGLAYFGRHDEDTPRPYAAYRRYTPPAYRITYPGSGAPTLRQRQTASGNTGGPPLRQRNNGGYTGGAPLRQRQTGL